MNDLRTLLETLNDRDLDYVIARSKTSSTTKALGDCGFSKGWFYKHTKDEQDNLEDIALRLKRESAIKATMILQDAVELAALVKVEGLSSRKDHVKQNAATEILDRQLGKPTQKQETELSTKNGEPIFIVNDGSAANND